MVKVEKEKKELDTRGKHLIQIGKVMVSTNRKVHRAYQAKARHSASHKKFKHGGVRMEKPISRKGYKPDQNPDITNHRRMMMRAEIREKNRAANAPA